MSEIKITIDGREVTAIAGETILSAARRNGIEIPTLCHDETLNPYGACGLCVVELAGNKRLFRACATEVAEGQVISTDTPAVRRSRKTALELLLSNHKGDCVAPCSLACPAGSDCQAYAGLIANNRFAEALQLIKESYPIPASLGRICPHPCEEACRRNKVDQPVNLARLKQFVADFDLNSGKPYMPEIAAPTGKKVAIIGGGPAGLTLAYFLTIAGHKAVIFEMMPQAGGMLRYGIPEYRLPKSLLDAEINLIEKMGVEIHTRCRLGKDVQFADLRRDYDAVYLANGAWKSSGLRCEGENLAGVVGGIDFLGHVALERLTKMGGRVAVIGGGNTAMDACRTAVRLGASEVYVVYRRTEAEMPAEDVEIREAKEEGVKFKFLAAPTRVIGEDGHVIGLELQQMELGEPDASGRRKPVPVEGGLEVLPVDTVIAAIGQQVIPLDLGEESDKLAYTPWHTISVDEKTFETSIPGVFAGGDAINDGPGIAVQAVGHAKKAARVIDSYLRGDMQPSVDPYVCRQGEPTEAELAAYPKRQRLSISYLHPDYRRTSFMEIARGYDPGEAMFEASRCLECGCCDVFECKLLSYAREYDVNPERLAGEINTAPKDTIHPFIVRDPNKCILCGNCVRVCEEVVGQNALGLSGRGFPTVVEADFGLPLLQSSCRSCGQCVHVCPTGALQEKQPWQKPVPLDIKKDAGICSFCGMGCNVQIGHKGDYVSKVEPAEGGRLCSSGRFGYPHAMTATGNPEPAVDFGDGIYPVKATDAVHAAAAAVNSLRESMGTDVVGVAVGDHLTAEELFLLKYMAEEVIGTEYVYAPNAETGGLDEVWGFDASTATVADAEAADLVLMIGGNICADYPILGSRLKNAARAGHKIVMISNNPGPLAGIAEVYDPQNTVRLLCEIAQAAAGAEVSVEARAIADRIKAAKAPVIVFDRSRLTADAARAVANLAVSFDAPLPVLQLLAQTNSRVIRDLGCVRDLHDLREDIDAGKLKAVVLFGVDLPAAWAEKVDFVMTADANFGRAYPYASVRLPLSGFAAVTGTYVNFEGRAQQVEAAVKPLYGMENWELIAAMINKINSHYKFTSLQAVRELMAEKMPDYAGVLLDGKKYLGSGDALPQTPAAAAVAIEPEAEFYREFDMENTAVKSWKKMQEQFL